jgi:hypothetical protein
MWRDCEICGEFAQCDKEGICPQCREEEDNEQNGEEETEAPEEDED